MILIYRAQTSPDAGTLRIALCTISSPWSGPTSAESFQFDLDENTNLRRNWDVNQPRHPDIRSKTILTFVLLQVLLWTFVMQLQWWLVHICRSLWRSPFVLSSTRPQCKLQKLAEMTPAPGIDVFQEIQKDFNWWAYQGVFKRFSALPWPDRRITTFWGSNKWFLVFSRRLVIGCKRGVGLEGLIVV